LRRAQRRSLNASAQNALQRAFIIDHHVGLAHAKLRQRFSDHLLNRSAKLLLHNAVDFQLNARLRRPNPDHHIAGLQRAGQGVNLHFHRGNP
jgi:hypothetical protein